MAPSSNSNCKLKNYSCCPFKIVQLAIDREDIREPDRNLGSVEGQKPLIIDTFRILDFDVKNGGVIVELQIFGRTRDGSAVSRHCNGGVCGGILRTFVIIIDPGPDYGMTHESVYEIKPNRLKLYSRNPSKFFTYEPIRISIALDEKRNYRFVFKLNLDNAEEATTSHELLQGHGDLGPGSGTVEVDRPPIYLISPKNNDILLSGQEAKLEWQKGTRVRTRVFYSVDYGTNWKKIIETAELNYTW